MFHSSIKDCSIPSETGYDFTGTTATTYLGTSNAACATGYEGIASPAQIQCEAGGSWTAVTGCTIKGKKYYFLCVIKKLANSQWTLDVHLSDCPSALALMVTFCVDYSLIL